MMGSREHDALVDPAADEAEPEPVTNAELMRQTRRRYGLNTEAMGRVLGLTGRAIEGIEQGLRRVDDRVLMLALKNLRKADVEGRQA